MSCINANKIVLFCSVLMFSSLSLAATQDSVADSLTGQREQFKQARKALRTGHLDEFHALTAGLKDYPLYAYLRYDFIRTRLHQLGSDEIGAFLDDFPASPLNKLLRREWLRRLARKGDWQAFMANYQDVGDTTLQCQYVAAGLNQQSSTEMLEQAKQLWLIGESRPAECDPAFEKLYASPLMTDGLVWQRIQLAMQEGKPRLASYLARRLDAQQQRLVAVWVDMRRNPDRTLHNKQLQGDHPMSGAIIGYGLQRLAYQNFDAALRQWQKFDRTAALNDGQRGQVLAALARAAVRQDKPDMLAWLDRVPEEALDERLHRIRLSTALKQEDWSALLRWTRDDLPNIPNQLRWQYWQARALEATGDSKAAIASYRQLSEHRDYYGFMASDRLGIGYRMNNHPASFDESQLALIRALPGIASAYEFYSMGDNYYARREWHHVLKSLQPEQMQMASVLAHEWGWHDRAIITLGKAQAYDDLERRFPLPWQETILKYAKDRGLPASFVYSIIRSESAFMEDARSPKGALGLMQLMPKTGKQTAKQIKVKLTRTHDLMKAEKNIPIGTAYMKQMLERFDGNLAMAAGAYNAGPHRVKSWQPREACLPAEIWVEMVPFTETRRYIRRALFYSAIYEWRLKQDVLPLESKLVAIPASGTSHKKMGCSFKQPNVYGML